MDDYPPKQLYKIKRKKGIVFMSNFGFKRLNGNITDIKLDFGTVEGDFEATETPFIFVKVKCFHCYFIIIIL